MRISDWSSDVCSSDLAETGTIEDEPERDAETVLTVRLTVASDLEPTWALVSARAEAQGLTRNLSWGDRVRLAPTRIGALAAYPLTSEARRLGKEWVSTFKSRWSPDH